MPDETTPEAQPEAPKPVWPYPHPVYPSPYAVGRRTPKGYRWEDWIRDEHTIRDGVKARRRYRIGKFSDTQAALIRWESIRDDLYHGRDPDIRRDLGAVPTLAEAADLFLQIEEKKPRSQKAHDGVVTVISWMVNQLDPNWRKEGPSFPTDHLDAHAISTLAESFVACSASTQDKRVHDIRRFVRVMIGRGVRFGVPEPKAPDFHGWPAEWCVRPAAVKRREKARRDRTSKYTSRSEIHTLLAAMRPRYDRRSDIDSLSYHERLAELRRVRTTAYVLLGVNCGLIPSDIGVLRLSSIDHRRGLLTEPRSKTGKERVCALWPETARALTLAIEPGVDEHPDNPDGLAFLTSPLDPNKKRGPVYYEPGGGQPYNAVSRDYAYFAKRCGVKKHFGLLRHTHATIGRRARDSDALNLAMGHADVSIAEDFYLHEDEIVPQQRVAAAIRRWLFYLPDLPESGERFDPHWEVGARGYLGLVSPNASRAIDQAEEDARAGGDTGDDISPLGGFV